MQNAKLKMEKWRTKNSLVVFHFAFCISADACYFFEFAQEARLDYLSLAAEESDDTRPNTAGFSLIILDCEILTCGILL
ncbi:MAG TPA: hypothetical protein VKB86_05600 [Pyrinomonadaceae bacterium]|nr:hypothetical protein [Pyrinomonadaceae bacterium]